MRRAAEFVAWAAFGGDRDDWVVPGWAPPDPEWVMSWLKDWAAYWRFKKRRSV